jgi:hypothetical protein
MFMRTRSILIGTLILSACGKATVDPSRLNSASARCARIAVYAQTGLDALPVLAGEFQWDQERQNRVAAILSRIRDAAKQVSSSLGQVADAAITSDQRVVLRPLLLIIVQGLSDLESAGAFNFGPTSRVTVAIHTAIIGLRTTIQLLPTWRES